jgi:hypothetical protein
MKSMKFKIGDRVRVISGNYRITDVGSEGVVTTTNSYDRVRVTFDKFTGVHSSSDYKEYGIAAVDLEKIPCEVPKEIFVLNKKNFRMKSTKGNKVNKYRRIIL